MKVFADIKVIIALLVVAVAFFFIGSQYRLMKIRQAFVQSFQEFSMELSSGATEGINSSINTPGEGFNQ